MTSRSERNGLSIPALQAFPLVKQYFPTGLAPEVLREQLRDEVLLGMDLDTLCRMDNAQLRAFIRVPPAPQQTLPAPGPEEAAGAESPEEDCVPQSAAECVLLSVDPEGLLAKVTLIQPPEGIPQPGRKEIMSALYKRKITRGVRLDFIDRLAQRPIYDRAFRIAEAQLPVDGEDSQVVFHFNPSVDLSPRVGEDGAADYRDLDFVKSVKAGALLCEITPGTPGVDGVNIYGQPIPARPGRDPQARPGNNTAYFRDEREIRATCDGQVFLRDDRVEVSQVLLVDQVDFSTGNIDFPGTVYVRGDVSSGFTIRAGGDIVVSGVVENAALLAGRNIALCSGVKGGGGGYLEARQDIRTLFIESCRTRAGGNIYADTILNSDVECGQVVSVFGKRGYLLGGVCVAGSSVSAVQIGNEANIPTTVILKEDVLPEEWTTAGADAAARYERTAGRLARVTEEDAGDPEQAGAFPGELARAAILSRRLEQAAGDARGHGGISGQDRRHMTVQVLDQLFPNVSLEIDGATARNTQRRDRCTIRERRLRVTFVEDRL